MPSSQTRASRESGHSRGGEGPTYLRANPAASEKGPTRLPPLQDEPGPSRLAKKSAIGSSKDKSRGSNRRGTTSHTTGSRKEYAEVTGTIDPELLAALPDLAKDAAGKDVPPRISKPKSKPLSRGSGSSHIPLNPLAARVVSTLANKERKRPRLTLDDRDVNVSELD